MSKKDAWKALREEIISRIDIRKVYETWGVKFSGSVSSKNWAECHAIDREDSSPSAGVNLTSGIYKDFAGETLSIFDFAVKHGKAADWEEAHKILAKEAGVAAKLPKKKKPDRAKEVLGLGSVISPASIKLLATQLKIGLKIIPMTGARIASYPKNAREPQMVAAFPIFDPVNLMDSPVESYVIQSGVCEPIYLFRGVGHMPKQEKRIIVGTTGILNEWALKHWDTAEVVYKTEGLSDMLCLQNLIPEELRTKHVVITNAAGCDDGSPVWGLAPHCVGKRVVIIHDRDVPGQYGTAADKSGGATRWVRALVNRAKSVRNVQLPYEMSPNHGKDLKDWIHEGHTYDDLLKLVEETPEEVVAVSEEDKSPEKPEESEELAILRRLNIGVMSCKQSAKNGTVIEMFNYSRNAVFFIRGIKSYSYQDMLVDFFETAKSEVEENDGIIGPKLSVRQVRNAIAVEAGKKHEIRKRVGLGVWYLGEHRLVFVGAGEYLLMNGSLRKIKGPQIDRHDIVIQVGQAGEEWYDQAEIEKHLDNARNPAWRQVFFNEFSAIFARWRTTRTG